MAKQNHKQLFKKIIMSFFPNNQLEQAVNPTGMFVSFISTKQFFSLVNRKIVENYKLNLFDIALDPFEVKVGFGDTPGITVKEVDAYYGYASAANLNGYRFLSPGVIGNCLALVVAGRMRKHFKQEDNRYYLQLLYTVYFLCFVFAGRIKVFPDTSEEEQYQRFIDLFIAFYQYSFTTVKKKYDPDIIQTIKQKLVHESDMLFMLFRSYQKLNELMHHEHSPDTYARLFYDELRPGKHHIRIKRFVEQYEQYIYRTDIQADDKAAIKAVLPADILLRYIFVADREIAVGRYLATALYEEKKLHDYMQSFVDNDEQWYDFIHYITDPSCFKENYLPAAQELMRQVFRMKQSYDHDTEEEINEFISAVSDNNGPKEGIPIPKRIREESDMMEKLLNFYVTFLGGLSVSRGDNFQVRLTKQKLLKKLVNEENTIGHKQDNLYYFGSLLYSYSKNIFYYKYAFDNIRSGKQKFTLPYKSTFKEVYSNMFMVRMLNYNFLATLLQDTNYQDIKTSINSDGIVQQFQQDFGDTISKYVQKDSQDLIDTIYSPYESIWGKELERVQVLQEQLNEKNCSIIKDRFYQLDFWVYSELLTQIQSMKTPLSETYGSMVIAGILACLQDTFFGFLLFMKRVRKQESFVPEHEYYLALIYFSDVINTHEEFFDEWYKIYQSCMKKFDVYLSYRSKIDDNPSFFSFGYKSWLSFLQDTDPQQVVAQLSGEDVIWLKGYLKNIHYYNKRFILPSSLDNS